jgi:hypothetical protein
MNRDQRYRCPDHPEITVGATEGEDTPPTCQFDRKPMRPVEPSSPPITPPIRDPRRTRPPRRESKPL